MPRYIAILFALPLLLSCNESAEAKSLAQKKADEIISAGGKDSNFVELAKSLEEQFDALYKSLNILPLPISSSQVKYYDSELSKLFTRVPKTLIPVFKFIDENKHGSYDKDFVDAVKIPEYGNVKIIIICVVLQSGQDVLYLSTFLNNAIVDRLEIYSEDDWEYNGSIGTVKTSFSITNNYELLIKKTYYNGPLRTEYEINTEQRIYTISDGGKFVKK